MWIKLVTTKVKVKGKHAKKVYRYVKVLKSEYDSFTCQMQDRVVATLGTLGDVHHSREQLLKGIQALPNPHDLSG